VKKLYYRLLLTIIVLASVMPFIMKGQDGRPLMTMANLKMPDLKIPGKDAVGTLIDDTRDNTSLEEKDAVVKVYRWQDDGGVWHFSDDANPEGQSEVVDVQLNASVTETNTVQAAGASQVPGADVDKLLQPGFIPVLHAGEALDQARNVEKLLQQRYQNQEQTLSD